MHSANLGITHFSARKPTKPVWRYNTGREAEERGQRSEARVQRAPLAARRQTETCLSLPKTATSRGLRNKTRTSPSLIVEEEVVARKRWPSPGLSAAGKECRAGRKVGEEAPHLASANGRGMPRGTQTRGKEARRPASPGGCEGARKAVA